MKISDNKQKLFNYATLHLDFWISNFSRKYRDTYSILVPSTCEELALQLISRYIIGSLNGWYLYNIHIKWFQNCHITKNINTYALSLNLFIIEHISLASACCKYQLEISLCSMSPSWNTLCLRCLSTAILYFALVSSSFFFTYLWIDWNCFTMFFVVVLKLGISLPRIFFF